VIQGLHANLIQFDIWILSQLRFNFFLDFRVRSAFANAACLVRGASGQSTDRNKYKDVKTLRQECFHGDLQITISVVMHIPSARGWMRDWRSAITSFYGNRDRSRSGIRKPGCVDASDLGAESNPGYH
jgi:hypothetical protein